MVKFDTSDDSGRMKPWHNHAKLGVRIPFSFDGQSVAIEAFHPGRPEPEAVGPVPLQKGATRPQEHHHLGRH